MVLCTSICHIGVYGWGMRVQLVLVLIFRAVVRFSVSFPGRFGGKSVKYLANSVLKPSQCSFTKYSVLNKIIRLQFTIDIIKKSN